MATTPTPVPRVPRKKSSKAANGSDPTKHTLQIQFTEPEDVELYTRLAASAKSERRPLAIYVLLGLHEHFPRPKGSEE